MWTIDEALMYLAHVPNLAWQRLSLGAMGWREADLDKYVSFFHALLSAYPRIRIVWSSYRHYPNWLATHLHKHLPHDMAAQVELR